MAIRCNTALVDPPNAMVNVMAFSKAALVMINSLSELLLSLVECSDASIQPSVGSNPKHTVPLLEGTHPTCPVFPIDSVQKTGDPAAQTKDKIGNRQVEQVYVEWVLPCLSMKCNSQKDNQTGNPHNG